MALSAKVQDGLERATNRLREWVGHRIDEQALDLARLYRASRETLGSRLRMIYENFLGDEPTLVKARMSPAAAALGQAIDTTINDLTLAVGTQATEALQLLNGMSALAVSKFLTPWTGLPVAELPVSSAWVLQELSTTLTGGGSAFDRFFSVGEELKAKVVSDVRRSLLGGESFEDLRARVQTSFGVDTLDEPKFNAYGSVKVYKNEARRQWNLLMGEHAEEIGALEIWWAELDDKTTPGCLARHGRPINELGDRPPRHTNCRCTILVAPPETGPEQFDEWRADADEWLHQKGFSRRQAAQMEAVREAWDPAEHPRGDAGKFADAGGDKGGVVTPSAAEVPAQVHEWATSLGARVNGIQKHVIPGHPGFLVLTDKKTGSSAYIKMDQVSKVAIQAKLETMRAKFAAVGREAQAVPWWGPYRLTLAREGVVPESAPVFDDAGEPVEVAPRFRYLALPWRSLPLVLAQGLSPVDSAPSALEAARRADPDAILLRLPAQIGRVGPQRVEVLAEAKFDPTKHPKAPAGSSKGGEFVPAGGGGEGAEGAEGDWGDLKTGEPLVIYGWRGEGGGSGALTPEQQDKFGRKYLLGDGVYVAPSQTLAASFGEPRPHRVVLKNPYVIPEANGASLKALDIVQLRKDGYDSIVIRKGQWGFGRGQEDLRQLVVFPAHTSQVTPVKRIPRPTNRIAKGAKVKIDSVSGPEEYVKKFRGGVKAMVGRTGTVTSVGLGGHPSVKIGGKVYQLNKGEVSLVKEAEAFDSGSNVVETQWIPVQLPGATYVEVQPRLFVADAPVPVKWTPTVVRPSLGAAGRFPGLARLVLQDRGTGWAGALVSQADALPWVYATTTSIEPSMPERETARTLPALLDVLLAQPVPPDPSLVLWDKEGLRCVFALTSGQALYAREDFRAPATYERVAVYCPEGGKVWAVRPRGHPYWVLPGGHVDSGESKAGAAIREMAEETGVPVALTGYLGRLSRPWATTHVFLGRPSGPVGAPTTLDEIDAVAAVELEDLDPSERLWLQARQPMAEAKAFDPAEHPRGEKGMFAFKGAGIKPSPMSTTAVKGQRVYTSNDSVRPQREKMTKLQVGRLGEELAVDWLQKQGIAAERLVVEGRNNFPVDLLAWDKEGPVLWEVKAGRVSNKRSSQQWRVTLGKPGPKVTAWLKTASPAAKKRFNKLRATRALRRKEEERQKAEKILGQKVRLKTLALVIDTDRQTADVHQFDGAHRRIGWVSEQARDGYTGTVKYQPRKQTEAEAGLRLAAPVQATFVEAKFDPAKHPKAPAGSSKGGEFVAAGGADMGSRLAQGEKNWLSPGSGLAGAREFSGARVFTGGNRPLDRKLGKQAGDHLYDYVFEDTPPTGAVGAALNKAVRLSPPLEKDLTSWRGMVLDAKTIRTLKPGSTFTFKNPASFTNDRGTAYEFAKKGGVRKGKEGQTLLIRALLPKGTKVARLEMAFGIGAEHVVRGGSKLKVTSVRKLDRATVIEGVLQ